MRREPEKSPPPRAETHGAHRLSAGNGSGSEVERLCAPLGGRSRGPPDAPEIQMKTLPFALALALLPAASMATQVTDNFESGTNPNQWGWTNNSGGAYIIEMTGGNPGAWLDSGTPYYSDHPNLTSIPPEGTDLRTALASGTLHSAAFAFHQFRSGCFPTYTSPATFSLALV